MLEKSDEIDGDKNTAKRKQIKSFRHFATSPQLTMKFEFFLAVSSCWQFFFHNDLMKQQK
jgi:hypothetical protein